MSKMSRALVITHWVGATPDVIWNAYSTPELFHQFFSPEGLSIPLKSVVMELEEPHKMVFTEPDFMDGSFRSTQTFVPEGDGTLITVTQEGLPEELIENPEVLEAFRSSFRKLGRVLSVETENR
jgi:uncharacterized protein YndB with AHSA1/START domain